MTQIYHFEAKQPPVLNEAMLQTELKKRQMRRQTAIAAVAGILTQIALLLLALAISRYSMILAVCCVVYVIVSATGSTIIAILMHSSVVKRSLLQS